MKKKMKGFTWLIVIIVIIILLFLLMRIRANRANAQQEALPNISMEYTVKRTDIGDFLEVMGTVNAPERKIYGKINGEIEHLMIEENQTIEKEATLAVIDSTQYKLNYLQAKTAYENSLGGAPKTVEERLLSLQIAEENLANTVIKSPVSGFIKDVPFNERDQISPNSVICTIVEDQQMYVESSIDEVDLKKVKVGQKVQFVFEPLDSLKTDGYVNEISRIAETSSGIVVIPIKFSFNNLPLDKGVIPGLTCSVNILLMENTDVIVVPALAVKDDENGSYVFVKRQTSENQSAKRNDEPGEKRYIEIGQMTKNYLEVINGLVEGEIVIIEANKDRLREAMKQLNPSFTGMGRDSRP